jgi:hypothetical protein
MAEQWPGVAQLGVAGLETGGALGLDLKPRCLTRSSKQLGSSSWSRAEGAGRAAEKRQPAKSRAARELLGPTQEQLADMADLSLSTVQDFELGLPVYDCLVATIQVALEAVGIDFAGGRASGLGRT